MGEPHRGEPQRGESQRGHGLAEGFQPGSRRSDLRVALLIARLFENRPEIARINQHLKTWEPGKD